MTLTPSRTPSSPVDGGKVHPVDGLSDTAAGKAAGLETGRSSSQADPAPNYGAALGTGAASGAMAGMDPRLTTIQPGGGIVMSIELAWGRLRRWLLRTFRPGYVEQMRKLRQGGRGSLPFEPVDSRDLKFYRNQETYWWPDSDDSFRWRDSLPFARVGLAELILIGGFFCLLGVLLFWVWWPLSLPPLVVCALVVWFFRDPPRDIPTEHGLVVSPADGLIVQIDPIEDPEIGPAVQIGIFLSIFNVHINRSSLEGSVVAVRYQPGKFLNALRPQSARENENLDVVLQSRERPFRPFRIRQITGQFARRIVCWARPGDLLSKGEQYGMIKLGSRTELVIPRDESLEICVAIGDKVAAGATRLARYRFDVDASEAAASAAPVSEPEPTANAFDVAAAEALSPPTAAKESDER